MLHHKLCGAGAIVALCASPALAAPVDLGERGMSLFWLLFSQDGFTVGDKHFSDVRYYSRSVGPWDLDIMPVDLGPEGGIGFDIVPKDSMRTSSNDLSFKLSYTVSVTDPDYLITDAHLAFDGWYDDGDDHHDRSGSGGGIGVHETISANGEKIGEMSVHANKNGARLSDWIVFDPVQSVSVEKWFTANGDFSTQRTGGHHGGDPDVGVSFIRQTFTQIPGPATALALAIGAPLASRRRRPA